MSLQEFPLIDGDGRLHIYDRDDHGIRLHISGISKLWYSLFQKTFELKSPNTTYVINANSAINYFKQYGISDKPSTLAKELYSQVIRHEAAKSLEKFTSTLNQVEHCEQTISEQYPQTKELVRSLILSCKEQKERLLSPSSDVNITVSIQETKRALTAAAHNLNVLLEQLKQPQHVEEVAKKLNEAERLPIDHMSVEKLQKLVRQAKGQAEKTQREPAKVKQYARLENDLVTYATRRIPCRAIFSAPMSNVIPVFMSLAEKITHYSQQTLREQLEHNTLCYETLPQHQDAITTFKNCPLSYNFALTLLSKIAKFVQDNSAATPTPTLPSREVRKLCKSHLSLLDEMLKHNLYTVGLERTLDGLINSDFAHHATLSSAFEEAAGVSATRDLPSTIKKQLQAIVKKLHQQTQPPTLDTFARATLFETLGVMQDFQFQSREEQRALEKALKELTNLNAKSSEEVRLMGPSEASKIIACFEALLKLLKK